MPGAPLPGAACSRTHGQACASSPPARRSASCWAPPPASCSASGSPTSARCPGPRGARRRRHRLRRDGHRRRPRHRRSARCAPASPPPARGPGAAPTSLGALCMAIELVACGLLHTSGSSSPRWRWAASATAWPSSTTACCSLRAPRRRCTAACSRSRRPAPRSPSRSPSSPHGALIAGAGVETAFLVSGPALALVLTSAAPAPARGLAHSAIRPPPTLSDALA